MHRLVHETNFTSCCYTAMRCVNSQKSHTANLFRTLSCFHARTWCRARTHARDISLHVPSLDCTHPIHSRVKSIPRTCICSNSDTSYDAHAHFALQLDNCSHLSYPIKSQGAVSSFTSVSLLLLRKVQILKSQLTSSTQIIYDVRV